MVLIGHFPVCVHWIWYQLMYYYEITIYVFKIFYKYNKRVRVITFLFFVTPLYNQHDFWSIADGNVNYLSHLKFESLHILQRSYNWIFYSKKYVRCSYVILVDEMSYQCKSVHKCDFHLSHEFSINVERAKTPGYPDSKVHWVNMGPTWVLSAPDRPHAGPINLAIRVSLRLSIACHQGMF